MNVSRRPAVPADLPFVLRAEREYMAAVEPEQLDAWTTAIDRNLALWIDNLDRTTVLEVDGAPAGFAMWRPDPDPAPDSGAAATLVTVQVLPAYRRRGLGLHLLELFAEQAAAAGLDVLRLGVHDDNPARDIYPRAGYVQVGREGAYVLYERRIRGRG